MTQETYFRRPAETVREPYHYRDCGLEGIYLLNGYTIEEHDGEQHVFIDGLESLHRVIGRDLIFNRKALTGKEVKFLRNTLDLTQNQLANDLGHNAQSIARWEKGQSEIPGDAEKLLRILFFARLATNDELQELRDFINETLTELDSIDESNTQPIAFSYNGAWHSSRPKRELEYA